MQKTNKRSKQHVIDLVCNRSNGTPNFALLIGAGASISSGVPGSSSLVNDWRKKIYIRDRSTEPFEEWLKQPWFQDDEEYSLLFEMICGEP